MGSAVPRVVQATPQGQRNEKIALYKKNYKQLNICEFIYINIRYIGISFLSAVSTVFKDRRTTHKRKNQCKRNHENIQFRK